MLNTNRNVLPKNKRMHKEPWSVSKEKISDQITTVETAEHEPALVPYWTGLV